MTREKVLMLLGSVCLALMLVVPIVASCAGPAPTPTSTLTPAIEWTFAAWQPLTHWSHVELYRPFWDEVEAATEGRLVVHMRDKAELGYKGPEYLRVLKAGTVDAAEVFFPGLAGDMPVLDIYGLPCTLGTQEDVIKACHALHPLIEEEMLKTFNTFPLFYGMVDEQVITTTKPVRKLEDFKGLKMRAFGITLCELFDALGSSTVVLPTTDLYSAFQRGTIEGTYFGGYMVIALHLYEVCKYSIYGSNIGFAPTSLLISKKSWDKLPEDIQDIIRGIAPKYEAAYTQLSIEKTSSVQEDLKGYGVEIVNLTPEEIAKLYEIGDDIGRKWSDEGGALEKEAYNILVESKGG